MAKFSLVRWITGADKGKYSVLQTSWIKGFDLIEFENGNGDESYVIEWRDREKNNWWLACI